MSSVMVLSLSLLQRPVYLPSAAPQSKDGGAAAVRGKNEFQPNLPARIWNPALAQGMKEGAVRIDTGDRSLTVPIRHEALGGRDPLEDRFRRHRRARAREVAAHRQSALFSIRVIDEENRQSPPIVGKGAVTDVVDPPRYRAARRILKTDEACHLVSAAASRASTRSECFPSASASHILRLTMLSMGVNQEGSVT